MPTIREGLLLLGLLLLRGLLRRLRGLLLLEGLGLGGSAVLFVCEDHSGLFKTTFCFLWVVRRALGSIYVGRVPREGYCVYA